MIRPRLHRSKGPFEPLEAIRWQPGNPTAEHAVLTWLLGLGVGYCHASDTETLSIGRIGRPALEAHSGDWVAHAAGYVAVATDAVFSAAYETDPTITDPRGAPMTDPLEAAARADHARHCRDHDPNITDVQIDAYWDAIGELSRDVFRQIAAARGAASADVAVEERTEAEPHIVSQGGDDVVRFSDGTERHLFDLRPGPEQRAFRRWVDDQQRFLDRGHTEEPLPPGLTRVKLSDGRVDVPTGTKQYFGGEFFDQVNAVRPPSGGACCQAAYDSDGFAHDHEVAR
jgi:hypothetical protein